MDSEVFKQLFRGKENLHKQVETLILQCEASVDIAESSAEIMGFMV